MSDDQAPEVLSSGPDEGPPHGRFGAYGLTALAVVAAAVAIPLAISGHSDAAPSRHHASPSRPAAPASAGIESAAPAPPARKAQADGISQCAHYANVHSFLEADNAVIDPSGAVTITGHQGTVQCGGADDVQFTWAGATSEFIVAPSARVKRLYFGNDGPADKTIFATALPDYLRTDNSGRFFEYGGPQTGILTLIELYHP
jgi:hypothetical protein